MGLRIAHITATFPPYRGGTGNVCFHHARELARRGHEVHAYTAAMSGAAADERRDGIKVHRLRPLVRVGNAPVLPQLVGALRGFDVVHLHYPFFGGEIAPLLARIRGTPLVITYHQDVILSGAMAVVERALRSTVGRATLRAADRVLFTSADYGQFSYVRPLLRGREPYIGELPNGVDCGVFTPAQHTPALRAHYGLAPADHVALLVAALDRAHYFKGVNVFLEALARLPSTVKGIIVGDGDLRAEYQALAERLGIGPRAIFAGRVADGELPGYYRLADVTVLPSTTMGEAFGLVLVESMACGTPVVATNLPGVRTVVDHGRDGLLVVPTDATALAAAIQRIRRDAPGYQAMSRAGRAKVEARYDWRAIGARLEAIYDEVLRRGGEGQRAAPALVVADRSSTGRGEQ